MGFLNPTGDDDYRISQMAGTTEVPAPSAFEGLLTAVPKGVAAGADKVVGLVNDTAATDIGSQVFGAATQQPASFIKAAAVEGQDVERSSAALKIVNDWAATGSDPRVTGTVGRIATVTAEGLSIGLAGAAVAGPWGAAALLGSAEGHSTYLEAKQNGVDDKTALEQAAITGGFSAASVFLPMKIGKSLATSVIGGAGLNVGFGMAQRLATSTVLKANGYDGMADQYRVFDGEAMAADAILGAAFGGLGHAFHGHEVNPADVDAAVAVAAEDHYNRSAPGIPTDPEAANLHNETMADTLRRMANGDQPDIAPDVAQKLVDNVLPDPIHAVDQPLIDAAHEDLPGFAEATADVPRQALPPETVPPPREEPPPAKPGEPAKEPDVPLDDYHQSQLDHLVHNFGDEKITTDDGREVSLKDLADEMQQQRNEAKKFGVLHEVAAACAARNGF